MQNVCIWNAYVMSSNAISSPRPWSFSHQCCHPFQSILEVRALLWINLLCLWACCLSGPKLLGLTPSIPQIAFYIVSCQRLLDALPCRYHFVYAEMAACLCCGWMDFVMMSKCLFCFKAYRVLHARSSQCVGYFWFVFSVFLCGVNTSLFYNVLWWMLYLDIALLNVVLCLLRWIVSF